MDRLDKIIQCSAEMYQAGHMPDDVAKAFHEHFAVRMEVAMTTGDDWVGSRFVLWLYIVLAILLIAGFVTLYPNVWR
jgi:hypothetical protein